MRLIFGSHMNIGTRTAFGVLFLFLVPASLIWSLYSTSVKILFFAPANFYNEPSTPPKILVPQTAISKDNETTTTQSLTTLSTISTITRLNSTTTIPSSQTKILGFANVKYQKHAWAWYQELEALGYSEHWVIAMDNATAAYCQDKGMRHDFMYKPDCIYRNSNKPISAAKQKQTHRRSLFGSRWHYVWKQLQLGFNVLLTDVDNIFMRHLPLQQLEQSPFDAYHAYAGTVGSFPRNYFYLHGFTVCGGMSFLRSSPGILDFVETLVKLCGCANLECDCHCDDQVMINRLVFEDFAITWDQTPKKPDSGTDFDWEGLTGTCNRTGHRVAVWDRHTAYRNKYNAQTCPNKSQSWVAMPMGIDKSEMRQKWKSTCGNYSASIAAA